VGGPPLRHARADRDLQQPRLEGAQDVGPGPAPQGRLCRSGDFNVSFEPAADLPAIAAAAGGAFGANVTDPADLPGVLKEALAAVHDGRSAVIAAHVPGV